MALPLMCRLSCPPAKNVVTAVRTSSITPSMCYLSHPFCSIFEGDSGVTSFKLLNCWFLDVSLNIKLLSSAQEVHKVRHTNQLGLTLLHLDRICHSIHLRLLDRMAKIRIWFIMTICSCAKLNAYMYTLYINYINNFFL